MFEVFSLTHFILLLAIPIAMLIAYAIRNTKRYYTILFGISFLLFLMECWKQYEYYYILHTWSVWIVPFQLCSIPLYIWLFYPLYHTSFFEGIESFLMTYTLLGALLALGYPEDMIKPELALTIHSFLWHDLLVFLSFFVYFSKHGKTDLQSFLKGTVFFLGCCSIATILNITLSKYGSISMFYLYIDRITTQPVFSTIGRNYGILIQNIAYILCIILGAYIINTILKRKS